ncbi:glycosyltransferase [Morganella morganii]|uniref:glycosyltransferase n=1 Tax=Morganella morganii TaxID=582 RepID=UPI001BD3BC55|nr:glycosyltransferase [Morganella morganii]MBS9543027.1 glycosyltransferase [Morganella morganii subsp. morganii]MDM8752548.1 glycosyltransferase [Morganella morganii]
MKNNIAIIITKSEVGGAQTWVLELYKILNPHFNIYLITSEKGWLTNKFPTDDIFIIPGLNSIKKPSSTLKIFHILRKKNIDTVISNSANAGLYSRLAKILKPHKHIYVSHGWSCIYNGGRSQRLFCWVEKILSYLSNTILCVSDRDKKNALEIIGIKEEKITVIKNKITPLPRKEKTNPRLKALFVGRMTHPKRADLFIEAAKKLPDIDFYLVGDGPLIKDLKSLSQGYDKNIFFLGEINNFNSYCDFDIFVLCSDSEGLPMSAIEAGSAGLPLVLSDVGGCSELIYSLNNQTNGLLVENNTNSITSALTQISSHYSNYYDAAQNLRYEFDIKTVADDYIKLIQG